MTTTDAGTWDVIVVGSGGGGLVGAYFAASRGLRTLVLEKTDKVGGTTAYSGAGVWYPGSAPLERADLDDDLENGRTYLRGVVNDPGREHLQDAYLDAGVALIAELEQNEWFQSFVHAPVPDYYGSAAGATVAGRTIFPPPVEVSALGAEADLVRRPLFTERFGLDEGPLWTGGRALIARALKAFLGTGNGEVRTETALESLIVEDGRVAGVLASSVGEQIITFRASRGVLLAAGGFERNAELREQHQSLTGEWSNGAPGNTGDAIVAGIGVGADVELMDEAWFVPGVLQPDGLPLFHTGTRGGLWVNGAGERFVNETAPYDQAGHVMRQGHTTTDVSHSPAYWILDQRSLDRFGYGGDPEQAPSAEWFESGALRKADTLEEVARLIDVPAETLRDTVETFNKYAASGVDEQFHRGESAWDQMNSYIVGFPGGGWGGPSMNYLVEHDADLANQLLVPLDSPPYYIGQVLLSDIGTKGGLRTDADARVLRKDGTPIKGLYATGNSMAAMSGRVYPGAGAPIGSSLAFGYQAVAHMAANAEA